jgi:hypothetical protein
LSVDAVHDTPTDVGPAAVAETAAGTEGACPSTGPPGSVVTTSCGGFAPCRLDRERAVPLEDCSATLNVPLPVTSSVTSTFVQAPAVTAPDAPVAVASGAGWFAKVRPVSVQPASATR